MHRAQKDDWRLFATVNDLIDYLRKISVSRLFDVGIYFFVTDILMNKGKFEEAGYDYKSKELFFSNEYLELVTIDKEKEIAIASNYYYSNEIMVIKKLPIKVFPEADIFKTIYNILTRSNSIKLSKNLEMKNYSSEIYSIIYHYQIQVILYILSTNCDSFQIYVNQDYKKFLESAIEDLILYFDHIKNLYLKKDEYVNFPISIISDSTFSVHGSQLYFNNNDRVEYVIKRGICRDSNYYIISQSDIQYDVNEMNLNSWNFIVNTLFGHEEIKSGQLEVLYETCKNMIDGVITCGILPTGYGKSLIYQLLSVITPKISIIVSPTEVLISDQLYNLLDSCNLKLAGKISEMNFNDSNYTKKLLYYATPKQLYTKKMSYYLDLYNEKKRIFLFIVDEVHQVSIWSHNFDVDYMILPHYITEHLKYPKTLFMTATANRRVRDDLSLKFSERHIAFLMPKSMTRDSIKHVVHLDYDIEKITESILSLILDNYERNNSFDVTQNNKYLIINNNPLIIGKIYDKLLDHSIIGQYVIRFSGKEFEYEQFKNGIKKIMLAGDEFNIGINIEQIRNVITVFNPLSKEWYYQETGRLSRNQHEGNSIAFISSSLLYKTIRIFDNNVDSTLVEIANLKESYELSNLNDFFRFFENTQKEIDNIHKVFIGISRNSTGNLVTMKVPLEGKIYYNNALHFAFILGFIKNWEIIDEKSGYVNFKVTTEDTSNKSIFVQNASEFVQAYSVYGRVTEWFNNQEKEFFNIMTAFVIWYYLSKAYQQFESVTSTSNLLLNALNMDNTSKFIEDDLEAMFQVKGILNRFDIADSLYAKAKQQKDEMIKKSFTEQTEIQELFDDEITDADSVEGKINNKEFKEYHKEPFIENLDNDYAERELVFDHDNYQNYKDSWIIDFDIGVNIPIYKSKNGTFLKDTSEKIQQYEITPQDEEYSQESINEVYQDEYHDISDDDYPGIKNSLDSLIDTLKINNLDGIGNATNKKDNIEINANSFNSNIDEKTTRVFPIHVESLINNKPQGFESEKNEFLNDEEELMHEILDFDASKPIEGFKTLISNKNFMNGINDLRFKVFFEEELLEKENVLYIMCLSFHELKNQLLPSRFVQLTSLLDKEKFLRFIKLIMIYKGIRYIKRAEVIEKTYDYIGYHDTINLLGDLKDDTYYLIEALEIMNKFNFKENANEPY